MRFLKAVTMLVLLGGLLPPATGQEMTEEELNRMIEEIDRALAETDGLVEQHDEAISEVDRAIEGIDQTLGQAAPYAGMAPIPLIGADGTTIDPQVGQDFEEAMWCLNGLDIFSELVPLDEGEIALVNSGMDFFAGVALENAQTLGLSDDMVRTMLVDDRGSVFDALETRAHPTSGTMIEYCMQMAVLYPDLFVESGT